MFHLILGLIPFAVCLGLALLLPSLLTGVAIWKKALTVPGLLCAWGLGFIITFWGGGWAFAVLAAVFLFTLLAGKLGGKRGKEIGEALHAKHGQRDAVQVLCNVGVGTACLLLCPTSEFLERLYPYALPCFFWAYCGAMAASLADSMASELGVLSKKPPRDILTMKPVEPGLSGGVTLLGLGASLLGAVLIGGIAALWRGDWGILPAVTLSGFVAALADSVLGSAVQKKYRCPACGAVTEKKMHCDVPGVPEKGFLNNDAVNFINNLVGAACAIGLYFLF